MSWLIETALANAAVATLLAVAVSLVSRKVRHPAVLHVLWVLVLIKLVTPPLLPIDVPVPSSWVGYFGVHASTQSLAVEAPTTPLNGSSPEEASSALRTAELSEASAPTPSSGDEAEPAREPHCTLDASQNISAVGSAFGIASESLPGDQTPPPQHGAAIAMYDNDRAIWTWISTLLIGVCSAGSLLWWGLCAYRIVWFKQRLLSIVRDDPSLDYRVTELAQQFGLSRVPCVRVIDEGVAPMLWGCGRWTWIVLPQRLLERLDAESRDAMLLHELAHFGRGDHWVRLLELLVTGLYWWHPVVWWARRQIAICEEECCDARVVSLSRSPRRYAEVLLETLDFVADFRPVLSPITSGISDVPILERRLRQIMSGVSSWSLPRAVRWGLIGLAALLPCRPLLLAGVPSREVDISGRHLITDESGRPAGVPQSTGAGGGNQILEEQVIGSRLHRGDETGSDSAPMADKNVRPTPTATDHPLLRTGPTRDDWGTAVSGSGRFRLSALSGGRVQLHDASTGRSVDLTASGITAASFLSRDQLLVGTNDGDVRVYDAVSAAPVSFVGRHRDAVTSVCVSPGGRLAVTGSRDGSVFVWDLEQSGAIRHEWKMQQAVSAIRCSPVGQTLAVACGDWLSTHGTVILLDLDSGRKLHELTIAAPVGGLAFHSQGEFLVTADWNGLATFWDVVTGQSRGYGRVPKDAVSDASFSPDNDALARVTILDSAGPDHGDMRTGPGEEF